MRRHKCFQECRKPISESVQDASPAGEVLFYTVAEKQLHDYFWFSNDHTSVIFRSLFPHFMHGG